MSTSTSLVSQYIPTKSNTSRDHSILNHTASLPLPPLALYLPLSLPIPPSLALVLSLPLHMNKVKLVDNFKTLILIFMVHLRD
jgi:hypothetical protein